MFCLEFWYSGERYKWCSHSAVSVSIGKTYFQMDLWNLSSTEISYFQIRTTKLVPWICYLCLPEQSGEQLCTWAAWQTAACTGAAFQIAVFCTVQLNKQLRTLTTWQSAVYMSNVTNSCVLASVSKSCALSNLTNSSVPEQLGNRYLPEQCGK